MGNFISKMMERFHKCLFNKRLITSSMLELYLLLLCCQTRFLTKPLTACRLSLLDAPKTLLPNMTILTKFSSLKMVQCKAKE